MTVAKDKKAPEKTRAFELMRKITAKNLCGDLKKIAAEFEDGSEIELAIIGGQISRLRPVSTQFGDSMGFRGKFRAQSLVGDKKGKTFEGIELFAPGDLEDELISAFQNRVEGAAVEFAAKISMQVNSELPRGYVFVSEPLVDAAPSDALESLFSRAGLKQLTAPAKS
jgi:hypothetical protein